MTRLAALAIVAAALVPYRAPPAQAGPAAQCHRVRNDDSIRGYEPLLRSGLIKAYARLFPNAPLPPDPLELRAQAHIRCMDGRLLACFTGANLPCWKINQSRRNHGADAFCRSHPSARTVPAFATGHDTIYAYRCKARKAEIVRQIVTLDPRGFAASLWAPLGGFAVSLWAPLD